MPYNSVADSFQTEKLCSRLSSSEVRFYTEIGRSAFLSPLWRTQGQRTISSEAYWKACRGLSISVNWPFRKVLQSILLQRGPADPKFQVEGFAPTNRSSSQKSRLSDLWYGIKIWTDFSSVCHNSCIWQTDGQTDRLLIARPCLHSMQRSKNLQRH